MNPNQKKNKTTKYVDLVENTQSQIGDDELIETELTAEEIQFYSNLTESAQ